MERLHLGPSSAYLVTTAREVSDHYKKAEPEDYDIFDDEEGRGTAGLEKETSHILDLQFGVIVEPNLPFWEYFRESKDFLDGLEGPKHKKGNIYIRLNDPAETLAEVAGRLKASRDVVIGADRILTNRETSEIDRARWFNENQRAYDYYVRWLELSGDDSAYDYRNGHVIAVLDELISLLEA